MQLIPIHGGQSIPLGRGKGRKRSGNIVAHVQVDDAHFPALAQYPWSMCDGYPSRNESLPGGDRRFLYLHQAVWLLMGKKLPDKPSTIDHRDRNPLNSQSSNLREASRSLQKANSRLNKNNTSGRKGVCWDKRSNKWLVQIRDKGKPTKLGLYTDIDEAADAYREAHIRIHGIPPVE